MEHAASQGANTAQGSHAKASCDAQSGFMSIAWGTKASAADSPTEGGEERE